MKPASWLTYIRISNHVHLDGGDRCINAVEAEVPTRNTGHRHPEGNHGLKPHTERRTPGIRHLETGSSIWRPILIAVVSEVDWRSKV